MEREEDSPVKICKKQAGREGNSLKNRDEKIGLLNLERDHWENDTPKK